MTTFACGRDQFDQELCDQMTIPSAEIEIEARSQGDDLPPSSPHVGYLADEGIPTPTRRQTTAMHTESKVSNYPLLSR